LLENRHSLIVAGESELFDSLLTDFVCLYNYEFGLSLCKIVRSSVILLLPLVRNNTLNKNRNIFSSLFFYVSFTGPPPLYRLVSHFIYYILIYSLLVTCVHLCLFNMFKCGTIVGNL
jgi:hypothetical protein